MTNETSQEARVGIHPATINDQPAAIEKLAEKLMMLTLQTHADQCNALQQLQSLQAQIGFGLRGGW